MFTELFGSFLLHPHKVQTIGECYHENGTPWTSSPTKSQLLQMNTCHERPNGGSKPPPYRKISENSQKNPPSENRRRICCIYSLRYFPMALMAPMVFSSKCR